MEDFAKFCGLFRIYELYYKPGLFTLTLNRFLVNFLIHDVGKIIEKRFDYTKKNRDQARIADRLAQFLLENGQILERSQQIQIF